MEFMIFQADELNDIHIVDMHWADDGGEPSDPLCVAVC